MLARQVISGWHGQLERVSVAIHLGFGSADQAADVHVKSGVTSGSAGRDVRSCRQGVTSLVAAIFKWVGLPPGHFRAVFFRDDSRSRHFGTNLKRETVV